MFKDYTNNQTALPLDIEHYILESEITFTVNTLVESIPQALFNQLEHELGRPAYHPIWGGKLLLT